MPTTTPWAPYRTRRREIFGVIPVPNGMLIAGGEHPETQSSYRLLADRRLIQILGPRDAQPRTVRPYSLRLSRWTEGGVPRLGLHPFALAHLLITGQAPREILLTMALMTKDSAAFCSYPIEEDCALIRMLQVKKFVLAFATNFDLEVVAM